MDVMIQEITAEVSVTDADAMLTPRVMAHIVAAVKKALQDERNLHAQRTSDTSSDVRGRR
jgi:pyruvate/oxaloacetate carboxyltransferase